MGFFFPNKVVTFNDKDLTWMTSNLQDKLNWKNGIYNDDLKNCKTNYHYLQLQHAISKVLVPIPRGEDEYQN